MASSSSPLEIASERPVSTHKRTYQACIPCRRRKVRCDLGSVDTPHDPPCVRCRREKKDCFFSETRRKRKAEDEGGREADNLDDDYVIRNRRSQTARNAPLLSADTASQEQEGSKAQPAYISYSDTASLDDNSIPNGSSSSQYPRPPGLSSASQTPTGAEGQEVTNETAAALFQSPIHNPEDALHLLFEAAGKTGDLDRQDNIRESVASPSDGKLADKSPKTSDIVKAAAGTSRIDPAIDVDPKEDRSKAEVEYRNAMQTWSRLRFVRAGWFTALEAMSYIEYYYRHLAPLTPVSPPDFSTPSSQMELVNEEPILTITLLTIASRYKKLQGPGGKSRSFIIHDKLWAYLQAMLTRMFWGQEQFGGGFCRAGASKRGQRAGGNNGGLRSLGTIESLILLSDWHPRSMHFPPGDDGDDILAPLIGDSLDNGSMLPVAQSPHAGWIEPVIRSDRMCWSLIGFAYTLAYELGIFDNLDTYQIWRPLNGGSHQRENQIGRLLHIYVSQTSGRLGHPNMLPHLGKESRIPYLEMIMPGGTTVEPQLDDDTHSSVQRAWAEMTTLMRMSNDDLFSSKTATRELIRSRRYLELLKEYSPRLSNWLTRFGNITVPPLSRTILMIEYEYMRTYINSLSLQAVLEECASAVDSSAPGGTPPALLSSKLVNLYKENEPYIAEVVDASRSLLRHVTRGLSQNDGLKHAPVRTHFRILSGAMFLLKSFAVGAKEEEVAISVRLLDDTVKALRSSVVDDVHLILRFADLLENLTASIRNKFVRFAVPGKHASQRNNHSAKKPKQLPKPTAKPNVTRENVNMGPLSDGSDHMVFYEVDHESLDGPLAGVAIDPIDPNDSSISIMPPPDFIYNSSNNPLSYAYPQTTNAQLCPPQLSPNQPYNPQHSLPQQQQQPPYDPGYDWLTLDVNGLISSNYASNSQASAAPNMWAGFGPEISDSLEMLGMLTNDPYSFQGVEGEGAGTGWT